MTSPLLLSFLVAIILFTSLITAQNSSNVVTPFYAATSCESYFKVNTCTQCQATIFRSEDLQLKPCFIFVGLDLVGAQAQRDLKAGCAQNCDEKAVLDLNRQIQKDCGKELMLAEEVLLNETDVDLADPNQLIASRWYGVFSALPTRQGNCLKNSTDFCVLDVRKQASEFVVTINKESTLLIPFDIELSPPNMNISYGSNGSQSTSTRLPQKILCSDCYSRIAKVWVDFVSNNPSPIKLVEDDVTSSISPIQNLTTLETAGQWTITVCTTYPCLTCVVCLTLMEFLKLKQGHT
ncbi:hypothetical protein G9A89_001308 [Geosiphon pyriformis]|nr:hypothetical protein G9A89_001308 [Geosiphon pyriformis]